MKPKIKLKEKFNQYKWLLAIFAIITAFLLYGVWQHSYSWYFQDETDHLVPAWMTLKYHWKVYKDFSTNHQPIAILYSIFILKLTKFNILWQLIPQIRLLVLGYALIAGLLMTLRFKTKGLISWSILSLTSYYFLGFHVLGEVFAAYAILVATAYWLYAKKITYLDTSIFALALFIAGFSLLPAIVCLSVIAVLFLIKIKSAPRKIMVFFGTLLTATLTLFSYIPLFDWWRETIVHNWNYWLPNTTKEPIIKQVLMLIYPLVSISNISHWSKINLFYLSTILLMLLPFLSAYKQKELKKKTVLKFVFSLLIIGLLNNRVIKPGVTFYEGFHLLPYIAGLSVLLTKQLTIPPKQTGLKIVRLVLISIICVISLSWIISPISRLDQYTTQYSSYQNLADTLKQIKSEDDRFLSGPDGAGYINIAANMPIAGRQLFHLPWAWKAPLLREEFIDMFEHNPPEFVLFYDDNGPYASWLRPILSQKYLATKNRSQDRTFFYILKTKWQTLNQEQKAAVKAKYNLD